MCSVQTVRQQTTVLWNAVMQQKCRCKTNTASISRGCGFGFLLYIDTLLLTFFCNSVNFVLSDSIFKPSQ